MTTNCIYSSGTGIVFTQNKDGKMFTVAIVPQGDQDNKKEIVAIVDGSKMGSWYRGVKSEGLLKKFNEWGGTPEDFNKLTDFLNKNLEINKAKKESIEVGAGIGEIDLGFKKEKEY